MHSIKVTKHEHPVYAALNALDAAVDTLLAADANAMTTKEQIWVLRRVEAVSNRLPVIGHQVLTALREGSIPADLGDTVQQTLANVLRISPSTAQRRIADSQELGPRRTLSGEPLEPWLPATAAAQRAGCIGDEHVKVIRDFFKQLPNHVDAPTRSDAERNLVQHAKGLRPDELKKLAQHLDLLLNPDGNFSDIDRARKRGVTLGPQSRDGMSSIRGHITPECRATLEAVFSKWAKPGMCNPANQSPSVDDDPSPQRQADDDRTRTQRNHDALNAIGRSVLTSGELGTHGGLPATIIVSTTLAELESGSGHALTAGGTLLPMNDVLRLATHAYHYLAIFDGNGQTLVLDRTRRFASPAQRIVLFNKERGCTFPGCTVPGYDCQAHHAALDWADGGLTNVDDMTLACKCHNLLVKPGGWSTRKRRDGTTEWIPPPQLELPGGVNDYHHPDRLLNRDRPDEGDAAD
jgi:hypothetical protein